MRAVRPQELGVQTNRQLQSYTTACFFLTLSLDPVVRRVRVGRRDEGDDDDNEPGEARHGCS